MTHSKAQTKAIEAMRSKGWLDRSQIAEGGDNASGIKYRTCASLERSGVFRTVYRFTGAIYVKGPNFPRHA